MIPCRHSFGLWLSLASLCLLVGVRAAGAGAASPVPIDFNRDIRTILSDRCYACHGPDENKRKAGLRLDRQEDAFKALKSGQHALVAGDLAKSSLVARILSTDPRTGGHDHLHALDGR